MAKPCTNLPLIITERNAKPEEQTEVIRRVAIAFNEELQQWLVKPSWARAKWCTHWAGVIAYLETL